MAFVRVRSAGDGDPLTEFDIPVGLLERRRDCYVVVDSVPRSVARPATFFQGVSVPAVGGKSKKSAAAVAAVVEGVSDGE